MLVRVPNTRWPWPLESAAFRVSFVGGCLNRLGGVGWAGSVSSEQIPKPATAEWQNQA